MTFVRRAAIAAALLAVPVVAAVAISTGVSAAPAATGSPLSVDTRSGSARPGAGGTVTEVKYNKKKKKVTVKKTTTPENHSQVTVDQASVINLTNAQRVANGCGAMHSDNRLAAAALVHSADMATHNYFDHTGSDGSDFVAREVTAGYARTNAAAENIAWGYPSAQAVVDGWMASPGHRANILNCANVAVGVGLAQKADGTDFWTQDFGRA